MVIRFPSTAVAITFLFYLSSTTLASTAVYIGCYSSSQGLDEVGTYQYQSSGYCQGQCLDSDNQAVLGLTSGDDCYCGGQLPPTDAQVDDIKCNSPCQGYGIENCGGDSYWSVYTTGASANVKSVDGSSPGAAAGGQPRNGKASSSGSGSASVTSSKPSVVTSISPGTTIIVTESPTAVAAEKKNSSNGDGSGSGGGSKTGVIVGVIIGVVALIAFCVGLWFFFVKRRKEQDAESNTVATSAAPMAETPRDLKIPSVPRNVQYGRPGGGDSRLNDQVAGNRASSYSLDDSNDYTRKILTVANPDH